MLSVEVSAKKVEESSTANCNNVKKRPLKEANEFQTKPKKFKRDSKTPQNNLTIKSMFESMRKRNL